MSGSSLYTQFRTVFYIITFFVILAAAPALILTELSTGAGGAINVSGSLRMMSYKLTVAVSNPYATPEERKAATEGAVEEFGSRLESKNLHDGLPRERCDPIRIMYERVSARFASDIRPLAIKSSDDESARREFMEEIPVFVDEVDKFVAAIEKRLSGRLLLLKIILGLTLAGALVVTFVMLRIMRKKIFERLKELENVAAAVMHKDFSSRVLLSGTNDEIESLSRSFNFMVTELEALYGSLEAQVAQKTADLDKQNRGLAFLAEASQHLLSPRDLTTEIEDILEASLSHVGARSAAIGLSRSSDDENAIPEDAFVETKSWPGFKVLGEQKRIRGEVILSSSDYRVKIFLESADDANPFEENVHFVKMLEGILGRAIAASFQVQYDRRLAVLEERSTIARELHDSIAQTLSFSRIQLVRLKRALQDYRPLDEIQGIAGELDEGVSTAYKQLREVLTTFRLRIHGHGFEGAVDETVESFERRTGIKVVLTSSSVFGIRLTPNEEVHLTHILREALANVEKHAQAKHVTVRVVRTPNELLVMEIEDDGVGFDIGVEKARHFGLGIMKERAHTLGATLEVRRSESGGVLVRMVKPLKRGDT